MGHCDNEGDTDSIPKILPEITEICKLSHSFRDQKNV